MARSAQGEELDWTPVIGRALAFLCLHYADMRSESLAEQARFLARFGIPRVEAARLLATSEDSLRVLGRRSVKKARPGRPPKTPAKRVTRGGR